MALHGVAMRNIDTLLTVRRAKLSSSQYADEHTQIYAACNENCHDDTTTIRILYYVSINACHMVLRQATQLLSHNQDVPHSRPNDAAALWHTLSQEIVA